MVDFVRGYSQKTFLESRSSTQQQESPATPTGRSSFMAQVQAQQEQLAQAQAQGGTDFHSSSGIVKNVPVRTAASFSLVDNRPVLAGQSGVVDLPDKPAMPEIPDQDQVGYETWANAIKERARLEVEYTRGLMAAMKRAGF